MTAWIRFIILPATVILAAVWSVFLRHRVSMILPFLFSVAVFLLAFRVAGFSPLGFFVSFGGYGLFAIVAVIAACVVRLVSRNRP
jgi:hypothetical protein